jgi:hypothetical protein
MMRSALVNLVALSVVAFSSLTAMAAVTPEHAHVAAQDQLGFKRGSYKIFPTKRGNYRIVGTHVDPASGDVKVRRAFVMESDSHPGRVGAVGSGELTDGRIDKTHGMMRFTTGLRANKKIAARAIADKLSEDPRTIGGRVIELKRRGAEYLYSFLAPNGTTYHGGLSNAEYLHFAERQGLKPSARSGLTDRSIHEAAQETLGFQAGQYEVFHRADGARIVGTEIDAETGDVKVRKGMVYESTTRPGEIGGAGMRGKTSQQMTFTSGVRPNKKIAEQAIAAKVALAKGDEAARTITSVKRRGHEYLYQYGAGGTHHDSLSNAEYLEFVRSQMK